MKPNNTVTPKLLRQAQAGNLAAFEMMVKAYEQPIYSYIYRLAGRREDAEDLTQETFVKLYRNLSRYDPSKKFSTWLYTIATHTVYDAWRAKKHHKELLILDDPDRRIETIDPRSSYEVIRRRVDIQKALTQLPPPYRNILLLYYYRGFRYAEIAEILQMPLNTVKTDLRRAKLALQQLLNG
ncbi:RNA polymerase sigma factor [Candidatus Berkelbacteria bacterium]|nr:RNA polymerase sigma factor [Candidatus Berkelbacteria bacterium]